MKAFFAFVASLVIAATASAATITISAIDISGDAASQPMRFTPTNLVFNSGSSVNIGSAKTVLLTNGAGSIVLEAGDYTVSLPSSPIKAAFRISVPTSGTNDSFSLTAVRISAPTYAYTNRLINISSQLRAGTNIVFTTNNAGTVSEYVTIHSTASGVGSSQTNFPYTSITNAPWIVNSNGYATNLTLYGENTTIGNVSFTDGASMTMGNTTHLNVNNGAHVEFKNGSLLSMRSGAVVNFDGATISNGWTTYSNSTAAAGVVNGSTIGTNTTHLVGTNQWAATNALKANIASLGTAAYSNASAFYLNSNPSNYVTASVTNGLAASASLGTAAYSNATAFVAATDGVATNLSLYGTATNNSAYRIQNASNPARFTELNFQRFVACGTNDNGYSGNVFGNYAAMVLNGTAQPIIVAQGDTGYFEMRPSFGTATGATTRIDTNGISTGGTITGNGSGLTNIQSTNISSKTLTLTPTAMTTNLVSYGTNTIYVSGSTDGDVCSGSGAYDGAYVFNAGQWINAGTGNYFYIDTGSFYFYDNACWHGNRKHRCRPDRGVDLL